MAVQTTSTLSGQKMTYWRKKFLENAEQHLIFKEGALVQKLAENQGTVVSFNSESVDQTGSRAMAEGAIGAELSLVAANPQATLSQFGGFVKVSDLLARTGLDAKITHKVEILGDDAGLSLDNVVRDELHAGATVQTATGNLTTTEIRKAVRALKKAGAPTYDDGYYMAKIGPDTSYDLMGDAAWIDAYKYQNAKSLWKGELGRLYGARFLECAGNQKVEGGTTYSNFIHGKEAFGVVSIDGGKNFDVFIHNAKNETANPTESFLTVAWKATFATKVLHPNWLVNVKTTASA